MTETTAIALTGCAVAVIGLVGAIRGFKGDRPWRSAQRIRLAPRCPKCWYELAMPVPERCPECGRACSDGPELRRTRRRWGVLGVYLSLLLIGGALGCTPLLGRAGWASVVPVWMLEPILPLFDEPGDPASRLPRWSAAATAGMSQWQRLRCAGIARLIDAVLKEAEQPGGPGSAVDAAGRPWSTRYQEMCTAVELLRSSEASLAVDQLTRLALRNRDTAGASAVFALMSTRPRWVGTVRAWAHQASIGRSHLRAALLAPNPVLGWDDPWVTGTLVELLSDPVENTRAEALHALAGLGPRACSALLPLRRHAEFGPSARERRMASVAIQELQRTSP